MKVQDAGSSGMTECVGKEYTLQEINQMAAEKDPVGHDEKKFY